MVKKREILKRKGVEKQKDEVSLPVKRVLKESNSDSLKIDLEAKFLCSFPDEFYRFWEHIKNNADGADPCGIFGSLNSLRLCGVFDFLAGHISKSANTDDIFLHDRNATDLPEMQTLAVTENGRYAYWRDTPETENPLLVYIKKSEHFPTLEIIGISDPFFIVAHLARGLPKDTYEKHLPKCWISEHPKVRDEVKEINRNRQKEGLGAPFHGIKIVVKFENGIGYRPLTEKPSKLKEQLETIATTNDESKKESSMEKLMDLITCVQFANDEMDYGMGLELGHNLFCSNYEVFDKMAKNVLMMAYRLLERANFAKILEKHMERRRESVTNSIRAPSAC